MKTAQERQVHCRGMKLFLVTLVVLTAATEPAGARAPARRKAKEEKQRVLVTPDFLVSQTRDAVFQIQSMTYHVSFSDLTDPSRLTLSILCRMNLDSVPHEYMRDATLRSVRYSGGRTAAPEDMLGLRPSRYRMRVAPNTNQFAFQLNLPVPRVKSDGVERLEGALSVFYATPSMDSVFLPARRKESVMVDAGPVRFAVSAVTAREGVIRAEILGEMSESARPAPIRQYQWTLVMQNGKTHRWDDMDVNSPADAAARELTLWCSFRAPGSANKVKGIIVSWMNDSPETQIPFVFEDIPLP